MKEQMSRFSFGSTLRLFSCLLVVNFASCGVFPASISCYATEQIESFADYIYDVSCNRRAANISEAQRQQIKSIYEVYTKAKADYRDQIKRQRAVLTSLFLQPNPPLSTVMEAQEEIGKNETKIDQSAVTAICSIRRILNADQRVAILGMNPDTLFPSVTLDKEQKEKMLAILRESFPQHDKRKKLLSELEYEHTLLMRHPVVDEKALFENQNKLNQINAELADEDLRLKLKLRQCLTWYQLNKLYNSHRANEFAALHLTKEQDEKVMQLHCKRENNTDEAKRLAIDWSMDLASAFRDRDVDDSSMVRIQEQIDNRLNEARRVEVGVISEIRQVLTPVQRDKLVELVKLGNQNKLPQLPYPQNGCPAHHHMEYSADVAPEPSKNDDVVDTAD